MKEQDLLNFALVVSLVGLFLLSLFSAKVVDGESMNKIQGIDNSYISLEGVVNKVTERENIAFIEISYNKKAEVIVFEDLKGLKSGDRIGLKGNIEYVDGKEQIMVEELEILENK